MNTCIMVGVAHFAEDLFVIIKSYNLQGMQLALSLQHMCLLVDSLLQVRCAVWCTFVMHASSQISG